MFLSLLTSYGYAAIKFDPPTWDGYTDNWVPHLSHNRPYYLVEVVPQPGMSPMLPLAAPIFGCLAEFSEKWFLNPLEKALTGKPTSPGSSSKRGNTPGHYFYDVHVYKFEIDPISDIVANPDKPQDWGLPTNWIKDFKPCYFSELDPFRWRYGVMAGVDPSDRGRTWAGWRSPDIIPSNPKHRSYTFFPWASLHNRSGHVAQLNPIWAAAVAALRGIENGVDPDTGWGAFCSASSEKSLLTPWRLHGRWHNPIDTEGLPPGSLFPEDRHERNIDAYIQLVHPVDPRNPLRPIPIGWNSTLSSGVGGSHSKSEWEAEPYWYAPSCNDRQCSPQHLKKGNGYVFLVWLRHEHSLGDAVGKLAWAVARKALAAIGLPIDDILSVVEAVDNAKEMVKKIEQWIKDLQALIDRLKALQQMMEDIEQIVVEAAKGQAGGAINAALDIAAKQIMPNDPDPGMYIRDIECAAMSAWELLVPLETLTSLGVCGKGLADVKEVAKTRAMIVKVRRELEKVLTPGVQNILHAGCPPTRTVHAAIESIHNQTDPLLPGSIMGKLGKATNFLKYPNMACSGVKFLTKPTSDPAKLLEMFGGVAVPGLGQIPNVVSTIRSLRDPDAFVDRALVSVQAVSTPPNLPLQRGGGLIGPSIPGTGGNPPLGVPLHSSPITLHDKQWWETELKGVQQDFKAVVKLDGIESTLNGLTRGDFLKALTKPLETQLSIIAGSFKTAGKGALKDFDAIGDQGKVLVEQVQKFVRLFGGGMDWQTFVRGVAAIGTIQAEFQNTIKVLALLQTRAPQYATEFDSLKKQLQGGIKLLADTIRTLDQKLAAEITNELGGFDTAKATALVQRLRNIESRAKQAPVKDLPGFPELAGSAGAAAGALQTLVGQISSLSGVLPALFVPLRPSLASIANNVMRLTEFLDGMAEATNGLKDMGGGIGADPKKVNESLNGLFSQPSGAFSLGQILALLGGVARQSRIPAESVLQFQAAVEAAGGTGAPPEAIAEKLAKDIPQRQDETRAPEDKARAAWEKKIQDGNDWAGKLRDPSTMSQEECRRVRNTIKIAYDACVNHCPKTTIPNCADKCQSPDSYPCTP